MSIDGIVKTISEEQNSLVFVIQDKVGSGKTRFWLTGIEPDTELLLTFAPLIGKPLWGNTTDIYLGVKKLFYRNGYTTIRLVDNYVEVIKAYMKENRMQEEMLYREPTKADEGADIEVLIGSNWKPRQLLAVLPETQEARFVCRMSNSIHSGIFTKARIKKSYAQLQEEAGFKAGDKVKVLRGFKQDEHGFIHDYTPEIQDMIGKVFTIREVFKQCIDIKHIFFPYFVLEKVVEPEYVPFEWEDSDELQGLWMMRKGEKSKELIVKLAKDRCDLLINSRAAKFCLNHFVFTDGSPVGKLKKKE